MDRSIHQNTKIFRLLKGLLLSYIVTAFILLLLSFLMLKLDLSSTIISGGINFIYIISAFAGGFYVGKRAEYKKFIWGLAMGIIYFIVLMLVSLAMTQANSLSFSNLFVVFIITSLSGMLGGMFS